VVEGGSGLQREEWRTSSLASIVRAGMDDSVSRRNASRTFAGVCVLGALAACTLYAGSFEPTPVQNGVEAEGEDSLDAGGIGDASAADRGCGDNAGRDRGDRACPPLIDPLQPPRNLDGGVVGDGGTSPDGCPPGFEAFGTPELVSTGFAAPGELFGPALATDGLRLYFSVSFAGSEEIYMATRGSRETAVFGNASPVVSLNSPSLEGSPFVSFDDRRIYFFSNRDGGVGDRDIWFSERADAGPDFASASLLGGVNSPSLEQVPWLARDELSILFVSSRPSGDDSDLWGATRASADAGFEAPVNLAALNSPATEGRIALSGDGLRAVFASSRAGGLGDLDLWTASRSSVNDVFSQPVNLVRLNSAEQDLDVAVSSDDSELFFASSRGGASALWRSRRACP
jgi:Tol biopolymer transport system component